MLRRARFAASVCALWFGVSACATPPPSPAHEPIPGTRVRLVVPVGFAISNRFAGLESSDGTTSVIVTELSTPIDQAQARLNEREFASRGMKWLGGEVVSIDGYEGRLVSAAETRPSGAELRRWIVVFGEDRAGAMVAAVTSRAGDPALAEVLRDVLLTAEWDPNALEQPFVGLGFWVTETNLLKVSDRLPSMVSFTVGGHRGELRVDDPVLMAGTATVEHGVSDIGAFAEARLREVREVDVTGIVSSEDLQLDGLPANELMVRARDPQTGEPLVVYQTVIVDGARYFLLQGLVGARNADELVPHFRRIAASFRRIR